MAKGPRITKAKLLGFAKTQSKERKAKGGITLYASGPPLVGGFIPDLPPGFSYVTSGGLYVVDENGKYVITEIS